MLDRSISRQNTPTHGQVLGGDVRHALFDRRQIIARKRPLIGEIIVKAVLDDGADGHLGIRIEVLHRVCQQVRRGVADDLDPFRIAVGDDTESNVVIDQPGGVDQHSVRLTRERRLGKTWADRGRNLCHRHHVVEALLAAIGKRNYGHATILSYERKANFGQAPPPGHLPQAAKAPRNLPRGTWCALVGSNH